MSHGLPDPERIADGKHHIANLQFVGIGKLENRKALFRVLQAQHRQVAMLVLQHDLGVKFSLIGKRDPYLAGAFDDVIVGHHEAAAVDDHPGAKRSQHLLARHRTEELPEQRIVYERIAVLDDPRRVDVHDRRRDAFDHRGKRQLQLSGGRR